MSVKIMRQVWNMPLKPTQKLVLLALADNANDEGLCWPSRDVISDKTGLTPKAVTDSIKGLRTTGVLTVNKMRGNRNQYQISSNPECPPVVTLSDHSSNPKLLPVVTEGDISSNLGLLPIYRTIKEPSVRTISEPSASAKDEWKDYDFGFDEFWSAYPKKAGKDQALKAWRKLAPKRELVDAIIANINNRLLSGMWRVEEKQFIKHPQGYINGKMWQDEVVGRVRGRSTCPTDRDGFIRYDESKVTPVTEADLLDLEEVPF